MDRSEVQRRSRVYGLYAVLVLLACGLRAQEANLLIAIETDGAIPGSDFSYRLKFADLGATAQNVVITDVLPAHTTFVSAQPPAGWTCGLTTLGEAQAVRCTVPSLAPLPVFTERETLLLILRLAPDFPLNTFLTNTATISSDTPDSNTGNNTATSMHLIAPTAAFADVSTTSSASPARVPVGELATFAVTIKNLGPSGTYGLTLRDTLPSFVSFAGIDAPGWRCTLPPVGASGEIVCDRSQFLPGIDSIRIFVRADQVGQGSNKASVTLDATDFTRDELTTLASITAVALRSAWRPWEWP
jgi:uncharacterized repeat protein (TIGR01451 family)